MFMHGGRPRTLSRRTHQERNSGSRYSIADLVKRGITGGTVLPVIGKGVVAIGDQ